MYQQRKDPANSIRIWTQNDYEIKTGFEKITNASKKFNQSVALLKISELVEEMHQKKTVILDKGNYKITFSSLLFVAKEILLHTSDSRGANISVDDLGKLCDIYHLISDPIVDGQRSDIPCIFIKMIYEQAIWQQRTRYFLPRSLLLFSEMHEPPYDYYQRQFETIFQKHFDISIRDFIILSVASSFCVSKYGGHFRDNFILNAKIDRFKSIFTPEKLDNFLNVVTLTNVEFRKYQSQYLIQDWREKKYEFNCLRTYPLIKNNNREIICPIPRLLLDRCTVGLYYELFNLYKKKDGDPYDFTKKYGEIFEHYIGILLKEKYQYGVNLFKAEEHLHCLTNQKIPDWIIYENDSVIIIECKSSHLPLKVLQSSDINDFKSYFRQYYLKNDSFQFTASIDHFNKLGMIKKIYPLVVINDIPTFYNDLGSFFINDNEDFLSQIDAENIQFMTLEEFETLMPNLDRYMLSDIIDMKLADVKLKREPFLTLFNEKEKLPNFDQSIDIQFLKKIYDDFLGVG